MRNKQELSQRFNKSNLYKQNIVFNISRVFHEMLQFMQQSIRGELKTFTLMSCCGGSRNKFMVDEYFSTSFESLILAEKVQFYQRCIVFAKQFYEDEKQSQIKIDIDQDNSIEEPKKKVTRFKIQIEKGFRSWYQGFLSLNGFKAESDGQMKIDLRNYLLRKSKKTDRQCYVLEAIEKSHPKTIRFCFLTNNDKTKYLEMLEETINRGLKQKIHKMVNLQNSESHTSREKKQLKKSQSSQRKNFEKKTDFEIKVFAVEKEQSSPTPTLIEQIIKKPVDQEFDKDLSILVEENNAIAFEKQESYKQLIGQKPNKKYRNIFQIMFPFYNIEQIDSFNNWTKIENYSQNNYAIFKSNKFHELYKIEFLTKISPELTLQGLYNIALYKNWHPQILQGQLKLDISSENTAIMYQKHKSYSKWYRQRDFLYLRHIFEYDNSFYIVDKSCENTNFIPFETIQRGRIVYQFIKISPSSQGSRVIMETHLEFQGLLNENHKTQLSLKYLKGFQNFSLYYQKKDYQQKLKKLFNHHWYISKFFQSTSAFDSNSNPSMSLDIKSIDFEVNNNIQDVYVEDDEVFFSIQDPNESNNQAQEQDQKQSIHQVEEQHTNSAEKQITRQNLEDIILDEEGIIVIPKNYIKIKHPNHIIEAAQRTRIELKFQDFLKRDIWGNSKDGGLLLINKKVKAAQDNVLGFILSTLKKNIFSGKGALNISLPVTVFNSDSNLQRLCLGLTLAPDFLEKASRLTDPVSRMKYCLIFGLTNSLFYFDIEKPFNPILGETYQGFICGCPVYAQQISHHPPISSIYMIGRGYKIHANLEATVNIHLNSGDGINIGWYHIVFDDGQEVCFQTPPAQFSGLTVGQRKFMFKEKGFYFDKQNRLYSEMKFQDSSGFFSKNKWAYKDQVQADIHRVSESFLDKFITNFHKKKIELQSKYIEQTFFRIQGRWPFSMYCEEELLYSANQDLHFKLIDYQYPLNSNSNYREDLYYRKLQDLSRSQSQKERLEEVQRADRRLREKSHGKKH